MTMSLNKNNTNRDRWAVSLCFSAAVLTGIQALRPNACEWMGFNADQSFALSATIATVCMFLATFILTRCLTREA